MTVIDRAFARKLNEEVLAVAKPIFEKYKLEATRPACTYDPKSGIINLRLTARAIPDDGLSLAELDFSNYASYLGLQDSDYGREIVLNGQRYKVSGLYPKARKNPIIITKDNVRYVISLSQFHQGCANAQV